MRGEPLTFLEHAAARWRFVTIAAGTAVLAALLAGWLMPPRYTARASILIDAPGGADPRAATAVSPVYLESLRTYEHLALSDSLFAEAVTRLHIRERYPGVALESLKGRVLRVRKIRDTKVLEIEASLGDPKQAQALAQYIAERTVALSRTLEQHADDDLTEGIRARVAAAKAGVEDADRRLAIASAEGTDALRAEVDAAADLEASLRRQLADSKAYLAEDTAARDIDGPAVRARIAELERQLAGVEREMRARQALLGAREARLDSLRQEQKSARAQLDAALARLNEVGAPAGLRSERLKIIDPGIVPERPSYPNRPLFVVAALLISIAASLIYLALAFQFRRSRWNARPLTYR